MRSSFLFRGNDTFSSKFYHYCFNLEYDTLVLRFDIACLLSYIAFLVSYDSTHHFSYRTTPRQLFWVIRFHFAFLMSCDTAFFLFSILHRIFTSCIAFLSSYDSISHFSCHTTRHLHNFASHLSCQTTLL